MHVSDLDTDIFLFLLLLPSVLAHIIGVKLWDMKGLGVDNATLGQDGCKILSRMESQTQSSTG